MNPVIRLLNKLGVIERHGAIFVALFLLLSILQFSLMDALIGSILILFALVPHPAKTKYLKAIQFGQFSAESPEIAKRESE